MPPHWPLEPLEPFTPRGLKLAAQGGGVRGGARGGSGGLAGAVAVARGCKVAHEDARLVRHVPEAVPERGEVKKVAPTSGFRVPGAVPQWP